MTDHYVTTIEGNTSDMVARRTYRRGDSSIAGYGRPNWVVVSETENTTQGEPKETRIEVHK